MQPSLPFNIPLVYIKPREKIAEVYVECSSECLSKVFEVLSKHRLKLGTVLELTDGKNSVTLFITGFQDKRKVEEGILRLDCVSSAEFFQIFLWKKG